jgi:hypothetical protein
MARASEFEWHGYRAPKRRLWPVLLIVAGLIAYSFLYPDRDSTEPNFTGAEPTHNETSAIANAAPSTEPELAESEPSAIATVPARVEIINTPPAERAPTNGSTSGTQTAPDYLALRRELLGNLH